MIEHVIDSFIKLLGPIATLGREKRELKDNALRAISHALTETKIYYAGLTTRNNARNLETESQLAKYWAAAAIPLRHIDEELALICEHKAEYWVSPEMWQYDRLAELSIKLDDVSDAYKRLIKPTYKKRQKEEIA